MTTLTIKSTKSAAVLRAEGIAYDRIPANDAERTAALTLLIDDDAWTVAEYAGVRPHRRA